MAALLQDDGAGKLLIPPVSADKAVGNMVVADVFGMNDGDDLPELPAVQDFLQLPVKGGVAQHVADNHPAAEPEGGIRDGQRFRRIRGNRFFQQEVIAELHGPDGLGVMIQVHGGNDGGIRHARAAEQVFRGAEACALRETKRSPGRFPPGIIQLRDGNHRVALFTAITGIDHAALSRADENQVHLRMSPL